MISMKNRPLRGRAPRPLACLRWRPLVTAPQPQGLRRSRKEIAVYSENSAVRRRLCLILLCSRRYLEGQRIFDVSRRPFIKYRTVTCINELFCSSRFFEECHQLFI